MDSLPEVCQYLGEEHVQERDVKILKMHLETLFLLSTRGGVEGARLVRESGTYPVVRELHLDVEDEGVRRGCERLVDVLMGDEAVGGSHEGTGGATVGKVRPEDVGGGVGRMVTQAMDVDGKEEQDGDEDDDEIVPIF